MTTIPAAAPPAPRQSAFRTLLGTGVGNALEWYDWNIYASFAIYMSRELFSSKDPTSAFLETMGIFAVAFVARPFGGAFFGWLADRIGRKHALAIAVIFASGGSLLIAVCPTYHQVGAWSSLILLLARLIQGLAHGGELPSAQTYLSEMAPPNRRGLWASAIYVTGSFGLTLGLLFGVVLRDTLGSDAMNQYGWRIPFAAGAVLGVFAFWIRERMEETEAFEDEKKAGELKKSLVREVLKHKKIALQVIGMTCGLTVAYYIWSVSTASVAQKNLGYSTNDAFGASIIGNLVFMVSLPLWGMFSDRFGRKTNMLIAMIGCAVLYVPLNNMVRGGNEFWRLVLAICVMLVLLGAYLAIAPAAYAEMFPTEVRATAFGVPYAIAIALFGGTAPYIMSAWAATPNRFVIYVIVLLLISAATILTLPETKGIDLSYHPKFNPRPDDVATS
ncbi:MFS transporter [Propionibacterium freudenreichii]|jgi:MHS family alpha-ketoglutarate permease-like MFS transporter|uniref:MFS transporter n=1 Tax=Propionibacterium freudenreichii TaxID=1744 RepID=UPI000542C269|nr:MFS transporter [Propionibacterium freudenreichii]MCT2983999.1 MFS transporter [Propionibacterium freudenreichii]MCT2987940.1 MFS transporter [Propionibacterium freudenreichii]MCT3003269.1 MFS transporter [Propionibacterium freudenreichii]MDK9348018.1 MFS transporter [Propionibacterium freudenreichii]MDK9642003.1 MFS transporter [Propionibacterium freudenreichii]